ncbi:glycosyltransferase family 87 protein [Brevundimonas sp.]|uniref:glycosyltransferase family 87 protein n=1 Tax=Brevundimonas sp. TaxID=1871086 RepID=UPI002D678C32|nr:glycosyltransferase family 87 protein [Brevundimonas sp.]HYD28673.1 glycosyltransferase family 87 protein [Brevundimonas sp.]
MGPRSERYWSLIRTADWFGAERARAYALILGAASALIAMTYLGLSSGLLDPLGKALGTDFASFWTASQLALAGPASAPWDVEAHRAAQAALFGERAGYAAFFYPPPYLLLCLPLALAPYLVSLALWLVATGAAWVAVVRRWLGPDGGWLPILAFPAVLVNAGHGQNGFLTAALFGAAALTAQRRPWLAGALFGALVIKPHLALLVPLFLILTANWRAFFAAGLTAVGLCLVSLLAFGPDAWRGFLDTTGLARAALEQDLVGYARMQSAYAGARLLGADGGLAWAVQAAAMAAAVAALWITRRAADAARGAVLAGATLLATPFLLDYDLTLLAIPLAWLFREAMRDGFRPWEKLALVGAFILPLVARPLALGAGLPVAPLVILALLILVVRRATATDPARANASNLSTLSMARP